MTSHCRGDGLNTSAPKRAKSNLDAPVAIISMAQQARPNVMGHRELALPMPRILSSVEK
jgi:hypothetical protein